MDWSNQPSERKKRTFYGCLYLKSSCPLLQVVALKELSSCSVEGPLEGSAVQGASSFYRFIGGTHMHHRCSILNLIWIIKFLGNFTIFFSSNYIFYRRIFFMHLFQCCIKETFSNIRKNKKIFAFILHHKMIPAKLKGKCRHKYFCGKSKVWTYSCKPLLPMITNY